MSRESPAAQEILVTPEMMAAGEDVLVEACVLEDATHRDPPEGAHHELMARIFRAMWAARESRIGS